MRVLFLLLIFAIGFSGYSAAAHAFAEDSCNPALMIEAGDHGTVDCPEDRAEISNENNSDSTSSKGKCLDCTHCCASHALGLSAYSSNFPPQASALNPMIEAVHHSDFLFSLLRPPRTLV